MKQTAKQTLESIKHDLIFNYGFYFNKKVEADKANDNHEWTRMVNRLSVIADLLTHFGYDYKILLNAIYR